VSPGQPLEHYRQYLLFLARGQVDPRLAHRFDASDLVQQTLLEAYENWRQFRGRTQSEIISWLRRILANNLADALRGLGRTKRDAARERSLEDVLANSSARLEAIVPTEQSSPSQQADRHERAVQLANALAQLPESQRDAVTLRYWHGWSLLEIGTHLDRTPSAVASLLKRALRQLRDLLKGDGE
jgi:RNA polymerase sigma-70 factor (ECF subfamily)